MSNKIKRTIVIVLVLAIAFSGCPLLIYESNVYAASSEINDTGAIDGAETSAVPTEVKPTASANAKKIVAKAKQYAWPAGTKAKKYSYRKGKSVKAFKKALKKYRHLSSRKAQSDCGKFVSVCVISANAAKSFRTLKGYKDPFPKVPSTMTVVYKGKAIPNGFLLPGDIIRYKKKNGRQHALIYMGDGTIAESRLKSQYPAIKRDTKKYNDAKTVKLNTIEVIRAK